VVPVACLVVAVAMTRAVAWAKVEAMTKTVAWVVVTLTTTTLVCTLLQLSCHSSKHKKPMPFRFSYSTRTCTSCVYVIKTLL